MPKQQELSEKELKYLYSLIMNKVSDGFVIVDFKGNILIANKAIVEILEAESEEEIIGRNIYDFLDKDYVKKAIKDLLYLKTKKKEYLSAYKVNTLRGNIIWIEGIGKIIKFRGGFGALGIIRDITKKKKTEEALKEREKRLHDIALSSVDWIWEIDDKGRYTYASGNIEKILGYTPKEIIGKTPFDFMAKDEAKKIREKYKNVLKNKEPIIDLENWNVSKMGKRVLLLTNGVPVLDRKGNLMGYRGVDKDITERKRYIKKILRLSDDLKILRNVNQSILKIKNKDKLLEKIVNILFSKERYNCIFYCELGKNLKNKKIYHIGSEKCKKEQLQKIYNQKYINEIVEKKFIYINDVTKKPYKQHFKEYPSHGAIASVVCHKKRIYGVLTVHLLPGDARPSAERIGLFKELVNDIGYALFNIEQEEEKAGAEKELKEEKKFIDKTVNSIPGVFYVFDEDEKFIKWNKNFEKVLGKNSEDMEKLSPLDLFRGNNKKLIAEKIKEVFKKGKSNAEAEMLVRGGKSVPYYFTGHRMTRNNKSYIVGMGVDISKRKKFEKDLIESEERYHKIFETAQDSILIIKDYKFVDCNQNAYRQYGYSKKENIVGKAPWDISPKKQPDGQESKKKAIDILDSVIAGKSERFYWQHKKNNGDIFDVDVSLSRIKIRGEFYVLVMWKDVTEKIKAQKELKSQNSFLNSIFRQSPYAMWVSDLSGTIIKTNESLLEAINLSRNQIVGKYNVFKDENIKEQGLMEVVRAVYKKQKSARFIMQWKVKKVKNVNFRGGRDLWIDVSFFPIMDGEGKMTNVVCQWVDITEKIKAEEKTKKRIEELRRFHDLTVGRELKMVELKEKINELENKLEECQKYKNEK